MSQFSLNPPDIALAVKHRILHVPTVSTAQASQAKRWPNPVGAYTGGVFATRRSPEAVILSAAKDLSPGRARINSFAPRVGHNCQLNTNVPMSHGPFAITKATLSPIPDHLRISIIINVPHEMRNEMTASRR